MRTGRASVWTGLVEASAPERRWLVQHVTRVVHELARSTAHGAACLGTGSCLPQPPEALVPGRWTDERGE